MPEVLTQADQMAAFYMKVYGTEMPDDIAKTLDVSALKEASGLPQIGITVPSGENMHIHEAPFVAFIIDLDLRIRYLEIASSSSAQAHAFMGAMVEKKSEASWKVKWDALNEPGASRAEWKKVEPPATPIIRDIRIEIPSGRIFRSHIHHVAVLDRDAGLIIADRGATIWHKLRERLTCPTLEAWGEDLMPRIMKSGVLMQTKTYGLPEGYRAFTLAPDAQSLFDKIVGEHVRKLGGLPKPATKS